MVTKKKPSPAQLAARKLFAKRAKAGTLKKSGVSAGKKRTSNPAKQKRIPTPDTIEYFGSLTGPHRGPGYQWEYTVIDNVNNHILGSFTSKKDALKFACMKSDETDHQLRIEAEAFR